MLSGLNKGNEVIEIDLHCMRTWDAWAYLDENIVNAPECVKEVVVIHGYRNGRVLMNMVRQDFRNQRINKKCFTANPGVTNLILF